MRYKVAPLLEIDTYETIPFDNATRISYVWRVSAGSSIVKVSADVYSTKKEALLAGQKQLRDDLKKMLSQVMEDIRKASLCKYCNGTGGLKKSYLKEGTYCSCAAGAMLRDQHGR